jgi:hypothetical protein
MAGKYRPNFADPRVRRRVKMALAFANKLLSATPRQWSSLHILKWLGQGDLGHYLRCVFICTDDTYQYAGITKKHLKCKMYIRNASACAYLKQMIIQYDNSPNTPDIVADIKLDDEIHEQAVTNIDTIYMNELILKRFNYMEKSNRSYHPLQSVRKDIRTEVLVNRGLMWDYDIENCAFTLIRQLAYKCGVTQTLPAFDDYLANKTQYRNDIAHAFMIPLADCKQLINALLFGGKLSKHSKNTLFNEYLGGNHLKLELIREYEFITQLRDDFRICWKAIETQANMITIRYSTKKTKTGKQRKLPITSKDKAGVYFQLESLVMKQIRDYLDMTHNRYFSIHDGFVSEYELDMDEVSRCVHDRTGYVIQLKSTDLRIPPSIERFISLHGITASALPTSGNHFSVDNVIAENNNRKKEANNKHNNFPSSSLISTTVDNTGFSGVSKNVTSTERVRKHRAKQPKKEKKPPMTPAERMRKSRENKKKLLGQQDMTSPIDTGMICAVNKQHIEGERNDII